MSGSVTASTSASTNSYSPLYHMRLTLLGNTVELERVLPITARNDITTTLNTKHGVLANIVPNADPKLRYFTIGNGGKYNVDGTNLSEPYDVKPTNMDLYNYLPIRCVPITQGLSETEREPYRMRYEYTAPDGQVYEAWRAKVITFNDNQVQYSQIDATTGESEPYTIDTGDLNPTPPTTSNSGQSTDTDSEISVQVSTTFTLTGAEITEVVGVIYNGDLRYAMISEIGVCSGVDQTNITEDSAGNPLTYTEAVMLQTNIHYTFDGVSMASPEATFDQNFIFTAGNLILA